METKIELFKNLTKCLFLSLFSLIMCIFSLILTYLVFTLYTEASLSLILSLYYLILFFNIIIIIFTIFKYIDNYFKNYLIIKNELSSKESTKFIILNTFIFLFLTILFLIIVFGIISVVILPRL